MEKEISIEKVFEIATELAPKIYQKLNFHEGSFGPEDVVNEYVTNMIERNYLSRFNPEKGTLRNYVYQGLRNTAINLIRKVPEFCTLGETTIEGLGDSIDPNEKFVYGLNKRKKDFRDTEITEKDFSLPSVDSMADKESEILLDELMGIVSDVKFSRNVVVTMDGKEVEADGKMVLKLLWEGFSKTKIAEFLKISEPTVSGIVEKMKKRGLTKDLLLGY